MAKSSDKCEPLDFSALTPEQFDAEIEKGLESLSANRIVPSRLIRE